MRLLASLTLIVATSFLAPIEPANATEEPKDDLAKLQGSWMAKVGPNKDLPIILTIKDNAIELSGTAPDGEDFKLKGELKIDEKASPKTVDWTKFTSPRGAQLPDNLAIYKLEGDSWTVCSGGPGKERPAEFKAGEGGPPNLNTWTRVKEKGDEKPLKGDLAKLQGTWTAKGQNDDVTVTMTIKVNAITATWPRGDGTNIELKGEMRVNDLATPNKTVDFFNFKRNDGEDARDNLGIYVFEGEKLKICVGGPGNERPTEFKAGEDGQMHLLLFSKKKE